MAPVLASPRHEMVNLFLHGSRRSGTFPVSTELMDILPAEGGYGEHMGRSRKQLKFQVIALGGALVTAFAGTPAKAGFFDFLFGGPDRGPHPSVSSYANPSAPVSPPPLGQENVQQNAGSTGHGVAYCVRLCDGQHFPLEAHVMNATPVEACRSMCPASRTKVYYGDAIDNAVAKDGARYADLDTAYIYRKQLVAHCTCNGKNAMGLAPYDLPNDPTLRPGDIVVTQTGALSYTGNTAQPYTPITVAGVATHNSATSTKTALNNGALDNRRPAAAVATTGAAAPDTGAVAEAKPLTTGSVAARWPR
jgi:Protein of unknown function (DUF2865)